MPNRRIVNVVATASALVMALSVDARIASAATAGFAASPCPAAVADVADCHVGRDDNGAWVLAAIPRSWNRQLIVHAHGGPRLSPPKPSDSADDLDRFGIMVRMGYAWVGSTYRRGGYGVRMAAADVEASRRMFEAEWGRAERTLLHGQSWGGNIAAKLAELHALDDEGRARYDGVLITNGVLTGGTRAYGFRADLRAVYQYYCRNHPSPDEPQYPVWQGLPADASMTREALQRRVDDCTGLGLEPAKRSQEQAARLADILAVTGVREPQLLAHLAWGTFHFQDLVHRRLGGRNPFDNAETRYRGSRDDDALNTGIERFTADPAALATLAYDADLSGLIVLPTLTVHAVEDPVVASSAQASYAATVQAAGRAALLVQVQTDEADHSRLGDATLEASLRALATWLDGGQRPDAGAMQRDCIAREDDPSACRFRR